MKKKASNVFVWFFIVLALLAMVVLKVNKAHAQIVVHSKVHPRLLAYQDSLDAYYGYLEDHRKVYEAFSDKIDHEEYKRRRSNLNITGSNTNSYTGSSGNVMVGEWKTVAIKTFPIDECPGCTQKYTTLVCFFKKPVCPVIYKPMPSVAKKKPVVRPVPTPAEPKKHINYHWIRNGVEDSSRRQVVTIKK